MKRIAHLSVVQNCVIRGFGLSGLRLIPAVSTDINVANTIASGNVVGVQLLPMGTAINVTASFSQGQAIHNSSGGFIVSGAMMTGSLRAIAADSLASGNGSVGFESATNAGKAAATFAVTNSKAANNGTGVVSSNGDLFLNGTTVSGNTTGFNTAVGVINSYGNNAITDTNNLGALTKVALQ
jgi:hypothetical protein